MFSKRACGILLHPTSLPGSCGIGSLGGDAIRFVDFLAESGVSYWQMLPLTQPACGNSPYSAFSAFAGNPLLIDINQLIKDGDLPVNVKLTVNESNSIDFTAVTKEKSRLLRQAAKNFLSKCAGPLISDFWDFCNNSSWLHHFALFMAIKVKFKGQPWTKWPHEYAFLTEENYEKISVESGLEIGIQKYIQWRFDRQFRQLKEYANSKGVMLIGDIPIFVAHDSVDVWNNKSQFLLDSNGNPTEVAGVPPDYFSSTGQLWGNPLYNWDVMTLNDFSWWRERFKYTFDLFDAVRIDHFRGFESAWHVDSREKTAINGRWIKAPGQRLFDCLSGIFKTLPIIAEDLGVITCDVTALRDRYGFPGMKIIQFAFDSGSKNSYLPHNYEKNCVVYTGTHDNDTTKGWLDMLTKEQLKRVKSYLACKGSITVNDIVRAVISSVANTAIVPFQDLLELGSDARMNIPGTAYDNWRWRFKWSDVPQGMAVSLRQQLEIYGRS